MTPALKSMKLSSSEAKGESGEAVEMKAPSYPWGLQYSLNDDVLKKLGDTTDDYEVGEEYYLYAKCKVVGKSEREYENSAPSMSVDLQITDLAIEDEAPDSKKPGKRVGNRLYGDDNA